MRIRDLIPDREALISPDFYRRKNLLVQVIEDDEDRSSRGDRSDRNDRSGRSDRSDRTDRNDRSDDPNAPRNANRDDRNARSGVDGRSADQPLPNRALRGADQSAGATPMRSDGAPSALSVTRTALPRPVRRSRRRRSSTN